ncbi:MAG: hypothetical protein HOO86_01040 [Bacteroidales bacterium]|nr:hypothetical protein [Bacteroidales bacterium]
MGKKRKNAPVKVNNETDIYSDNLIENRLMIKILELQRVVLKKLIDRETSPFNQSKNNNDRKNTDLNSNSLN